MTTLLYCRPTRRVTLSVEPQLASWDIAGSSGQARLGEFLDHAEAEAAPILAAVDGLLAVELNVGLREELPLTGGGRDLDNYLFPLAQRLGSARIAAMFGRKVRGPSFLALGHAQSDHVASSPQFSAQIAGSYVRPEWKATLRERLLHVQRAPSPGPAILIRGWAKSSAAAAPGVMTVLHLYGPGDLIGSEAAITLEQQRCPETVTALASCFSLTLSAAWFADLLAADLAHPFGVRAADGITIPIELPQDELADMIGASRSAVARTLRVLRARGMVHTGYRRIAIVGDSLDVLRRDDQRTSYLLLAAAPRKSRCLPAPQSGQERQGGEIHMLVFLVGALLGALLGGALCARYLRQEVAANIGPKIQHIQLQLDNIQAELNLAITTRHDTQS